MCAERCPDAYLIWPIKAGFPSPGVQTAVNTFKAGLRRVESDQGLAGAP